MAWVGDGSVSEGEGPSEAPDVAEDSTTDGKGSVQSGKLNDAVSFEGDCGIHDDCPVDDIRQARAYE